MAQSKKSSTKKIAKKRNVAKNRPETASRRRLVIKSAQPPLPFKAWKELAFVGESLSAGTNSLDIVLAGAIDKDQRMAFEYDFAHAPAKIREFLEPDMNAFVFLGTLEQKAVLGSMKTMVPHIVAVIVPQGYTPPPFVAMEQVAESGKRTMDVRPISELDLAWKDPTDKNAWSTTGQVKILKSTFRRTKTSLKHLSEAGKEDRMKALLWTMNPSTDWDTKPNNPEMLLITEAAFTYNLPNGQVVHEIFNIEDDSLKTFIPDFLVRHELDEDEHYDAVEDTIREAFREARAEKQRLKDLLLETYDRETLEAIRVVKIYPQNDFIVDSMKSSYVNPFYRHAVNLEDFPAPTNNFFA